MIQYLLPEEMQKIVSFKVVRQGKFITVEGNKFVAVDNTTGDAWTEEFISLDSAINWLNDYYSINELKLNNYDDFIIVKKDIVRDMIDNLKISGTNSKHTTINQLQKWLSYRE